MSDINIRFGPSMRGVLDEVEFSTGYVYLLVLTMTQSQFLSENTSQTFSKELYFPLVCGTLVPWPGIQPIPPLGEVWSPDHCIAREALDFSENLSKEKKSTQGGATCCSFTHTHMQHTDIQTHTAKIPQKETRLTPRVRLFEFLFPDAVLAHTAPQLRYLERFWVGPNLAHCQKDHRVYRPFLLWKMFI